MKYLIGVMIILSTVLVGCGEQMIAQADYDNMVDEKDLRISELESQVLQLQEHIVNLEVKTQEVNDQFERFEDENWRDVVPDADASLEELNTAVESNPEGSESIY